MTELAGGPGPGGPVIAIHAGAGDHGQELRDHEADCRRTLLKALAAGRAALEAGLDATHAVQRAVVVMEDFEVFNAGRGSTLCGDGSVEMSAALMRGTDRAAGAVACMRHTQNPILGARAVLDSPEVLLVGAAADERAALAGVRQRPNEYFITKRQRERLALALGAGPRAAGDPGAGPPAAGDLGAGSRAAGDPGAGPRAAGDLGAGPRAAGDPGAGPRAAGDLGAGPRAAGDLAGGPGLVADPGAGPPAVAEFGADARAAGADRDRATVGAVCLDANGILAAATSTGGIRGQPRGRVGDCPIIGAGTWADIHGAVSCTGDGEAFIRSATATGIAASVCSGATLADAAEQALRRVADLQATGGLIAVDAWGNLALPFTTPVMPRGLWRSGSEPVVWVAD